jgi:hypothetical protein
MLLTDGANYIRDLPGQLRRGEMRGSRGTEVTNYVVIQEITYTGDLTGDRLDALMDALMDVEATDPAISDPDLAASLDENSADVQMTVEGADQAEAAGKSLSALQTAIHAIGDAAPGWETSQGIMHIAPAALLDRLLADE